MGASSMVKRDVACVLLMLGVLRLCRQQFLYRGVTYRKDMLPAHWDRAAKASLYSSILLVMDMVVRRGLDRLGASARRSLLARLLLLWAPLGTWAVTGPIRSIPRTDCFDPRVQHWPIWRFLSRRCFGHTRILLSEEWRKLSAKEVHEWQDTASFILPVHPHGILPMGGIINGLTWFGGGIDGQTSSGARDVPLPAAPGPGLHQRFFPKAKKVRVAVASGVFILPIFYEVYRALGGVECSKPVLKEILRQGKVLVVCPGGASESRLACPGRYAIFVKSRKGFLRLALEERRHVVPLYTFGDEGIVPQPREMPWFVVKFQDMMKEVTGLLLPPVPIGLLRFPPLTSVMSTPIDLSDLWASEVGGTVSDEAVDKAHARYCERLQQLFDANKALVPGGHAEAQLEFH